MKEPNFFLPALAVRRPVTVAMLLVASIVIGAITLSRITLQLLPSGFTPPFLYVTVPTVPTTPADVEREIVRPVESILRTVRNVQRVRSRAETTDASFAIQFVDGTDMTNAYNQVRDRLERVQPELPAEAQRFVIWKFDPDEDPLMFVGAKLKSNEGEPDVEIRQNLIQPLERLPEVSRVDVMGLRPIEVVVEVDDKRANAAGVSVAQLVQTLQDDNFTLAAGTVDQADGRYPLRVLAKLEDLQDLRELPIGPGILLQDVADVRVHRANDREIYRIDGQSGYIVAIYKESQVNTVDAARAIRDKLNEVSGPDENVKADVFFDQGEVIEGSLYNLAETAFFGGLLAIIILFFFLRRARMTLVTAVAIPLSLLITITVMYFVGVTLNALSLMGLMLSVGMVVDNSIVVTEAIQRRRMLGEPIAVAAPRGAGEVGLAIIVATSTTIVVFLPMVLMSGSETIRFYLGEIGFPVCISLTASLLVSLVFIPLATTWIDTETSVATVPAVEKLQDLYARSLSWCLHNRATSTLFITLCLATLVIPFRNIKQTDKVEANINDVRIFFDFESTTTYEEKVRLLDEYEKWVGENAKEIEVRTWMTRMGGQWGNPQFRLFLEDAAEREMSREEVIEKIKDGFPTLPGSDWRIGWGGAGQEQSVTVDIEGPDTERLTEIGNGVALRLRRIPDVMNVLVGEDDARATELRYTMDSDLGQRLGVSPLMVGGAIDYALRGRRTGTINYQGEDVPLWIRNKADATTTRAELENIAIPSPLGGPGLPIGILAQGEVAPGYNEIQRVNGQARLEIQVLTTRDDLKVLGEEIDRELAGIELPRGYNVRKGDRFLQLAQEARDRQFALGMAIIFVFLLMGILFESFVLPFVIILSIPFAFLGTYWILYATGTPFDVMAGVGLIILVGIVVNNAIVLVDRVNITIRSSQDRHEALVEAGRIRLRPITMTAMTTIGGLIPMAIGATEIVGVPYAPLGRTVIGGLITATVFTVYVVPIAYTLIDDLRNWFVDRFTSPSP